MGEENNKILSFIASTVEETRNKVEEMQAQMATKSDLEQMATKSDIARLESKMDAGFTAVRGDIEQVHLRLDSIEKTLNSRMSQIEADFSRLRSAVYLLAKDRPEILRLIQ